MTDKTDSPSEPLLGQGSEADLPIDYDDALAHKARILMTPHAVRARANLLLDKALEGELSHVAVDIGALDPLSDSLAARIRAEWPDLALPFHSVWRRFEAGGHDRFAGLAASRQWPDVREMGRAAFDMALVAGFIGPAAPDGWGFADALTGGTLSWRGRARYCQPVHDRKRSFLWSATRSPARRRRPARACLGRRDRGGSPDRP